MQINRKPIMIDSLNDALRHIPESTVTGIRRISEGILNTPTQIEDVEIFYKDGISERISILDMSADEAFIEICSMIATHAALTGARK